MASGTSPLSGTGAKRLPATPVKALPLPRFSVSPSAAAITAIIVLTFAATVFITTSVSEGFNRYRTAVSLIRTRSDVNRDLLAEDSATNGYFNTHLPQFVTQYQAVAARTPHDIDRLDENATASGISETRVLVRDLRETYSTYTAAVGPLLNAPRVSDIDQEIPRKLQFKMRSILQDFESYARSMQDTTIRRVRGTVVGGSIALLCSAVALGLVGIFGDNARRREQRGLNRELDARNRELERSNAALQDFAYVASHDLQEPLRTVTSYTQLLQKRYGDRLGAEGAEFIGYATDAAKRMGQLIDALLEYSRVASSRAFEKVQSASELDVALRNLSSRIEENGAFIETGRMPLVRANPGQLALVFQNLVGNSLKYRSPERTPVVRIGAEHREDEWVFSVADNGIGIAPEHQERIFKMFQRLHARAEYDGTGIGLALVKRIVELHGGRIWVESTEGQGSTFSFTVKAVE
jgi:signal transduction histidine kinase